MSTALFEGFKPHGWVLLSGALPTIGGAFPDLADRLLQRIDLSRPPLGIVASSDRSHEMTVFMEELGDLIGAEGAILALGEEDAYRLEDAGLIALAGGDTQEWMHVFLQGGLEQRLLDFLQAEGLVLAAGAAAGILGSWVLAGGNSGPIEGLGWLPGAIVLPEVSDPAALPEVRQLLAFSGRRFALGLPPEAALAIGPGGGAEVWSLAAPKLVLGKGWRE